MAMLDRTTRRLIEGLKARIKVLTVLVVVLAIALTVMTVLYITKGEEKTGKTASADISSTENIQLESQNTVSPMNDNKNSSAEGEAEGSEPSTSSKTSSNTSKDSSSKKEEASSGSNSSDASFSKDTAASVILNDKYGWNLTLVNGKNPIPKGHTVKTEKIKASYARDVGMLFDSRAVSYLNSMCAAAEKDGVNLLVISSHRTNSRQTTLFNNQVAKQRANYPNLSEAELIKKASTISAYPGTSEHEIGLAVDFNSVETSFENTAQYQWLKTHAADYGFILRYTKEKQSITGVIYEPWHYRYVGKEHAKKINELGYCLEEYIDYLNKQGK